MRNSYDEILNAVKLKLGNIETPSQENIEQAIKKSKIFLLAMSSTVLKI